MSWFMSLFRRKREQFELLNLRSTIERDRFSQAAHESATASSDVRDAVARRISQAAPLREILSGVIERQREQDRSR